MVQSIYNNYSPQYNYYSRPMLNQPQPQPGVFPVPYPVMPQYQTDYTYIPPQFIQTIPQYFYRDYQNPQAQEATQNIFNQPIYSQAYYTNQQPQIQSQPQQKVTPVSITQQPANQAPVAQPVQPQNVDLCPWVSDPELKLALNKLGEITHDPQDVAHIRSIGINPPFNNGKEALDFIAQNQIKVEFADLGNSVAHAQYINDLNKVVINKKYQGQMTLPMALAIADAIYHEAGHAKDRDNVSSLQEELDCMSLNVLGYRYQQQHYPEIINASGQSRLISDGVALYPKLFFDQDPSKTGLIKRMAEKYGFLDLTSPNHQLPVQPIALSAKSLYNVQNQNSNVA